MYQTTDVPSEEYLWIHCTGTALKYSYVTFRPANIPDAPLMIIDTYHKDVIIYLPRSVDEWEIRFYSDSEPLSQLDPLYLKNAGVVNLKEMFRYHIKDGLHLELSWGQYICRRSFILPYYAIPDVDCSILNNMPGWKDIVYIVNKLI